MNPLKKILVLALALLLSQTAVAVHDIHCVDGDHNQTCEIYFTQDQSASSNTAHSLPERKTFNEKTDARTALISPTISILSYLSRGPPL